MPSFLHFDISPKAKVSLATLMNWSVAFSSSRSRPWIRSCGTAWCWIPLGWFKQWSLNVMHIYLVRKHKFHAVTLLSNQPNKMSSLHDMIYPARRLRMTKWMRWRLPVSWLCSALHCTMKMRQRLSPWPSPLVAPRTGLVLTTSMYIFLTQINKWQPIINQPMVY